jgi:DNA polymerase-4
MSILHTHIPDFAFRVSSRRQADWEARPVLLLGPDERVWAMSPPARNSHVAIGLPLRQALSRCPDAAVHELDLAAVESAQAAFTTVIAQTGLPVEVSGEGAAYCDLSTVSTSPPDAQPICVEIGKQMRQSLGAPLTPAIGCDTGKFTARAAAHVARPGRMRIVDGPDEARFLGVALVTGRKQKIRGREM